MTTFGVNFWFSVFILVAIVAIVFHILLIRLYVVEKSHQNCFTTICLSRSIVHIASSSIYLIVHIYEDNSHSPSHHDFFYFIQFITAYYAGSELLLSINRCIAILKWDVYNQIFSPTNSMFFICSPIVIAVCLQTSHLIAIYSPLKWLGEIAQYAMVYDPLCTTLSHIVNLITLIAIIVYKCKSDSTRLHNYNIFRKNVKTFIFSYLQLLFTSITYLTSWPFLFLDKSGFIATELLRACLILLCFKDFLEGLSLIILYRKLVFNFKKQNNRVYVLTMQS